MKTQLTLSGTYPATYNLHLLGICLTLITACSIFKEKSFYQTDSLHRKATRREIKSESVATSQALRIYSSSDSTDKQSFAEIFPKGSFSYSPAHGFSGEAERLIINEHVKEGKRRMGSVWLEQSSKISTGIKETERTRTEIRLKEKSLKTSNLNWLYLAGCGLIFGLIWLFRSKLKLVSKDDAYHGL